MRAQCLACGLPGPKEFPLVNWPFRARPLDAADPLSDQWAVIALGPHISAAMIAREQPCSSGRYGDQHFDMVLTYDRELVTAAARALMDRLL